MARKSDIEKLFRTHYAAMLTLATATLHDRDAANDVVHGVFAALLASGSADTVDGAYLLRATRNRALNHLRNLDARQRIAEMYTLENGADGESHDLELPDYDGMSRLIADSLTPRAGQVVRLRFYNGMKYAEISEALGISEAAVYKHLRNAIQTLRLKIKEQYG